MLLIADSGSTKTEWALLDEGDVRIFASEGVNPVFTDSGKIEKIVTSCLPVAPEEITGVSFYGAGCNERNSGTMRELLGSIFPEAVTAVTDDLTAAARSLLGSEKGIAAILGTGSNSGSYDGENITGSVPSMGYILGDEGSGTALGKRLLNSAFKGLLPEHITNKFFKAHPLTYPELVENVYRSPLPNRYIAGFAKFVKDNIADPEMEALVKECFSEFIARNLLGYDNIRENTVSFTGSVAFHFAGQLEECLADYGLRPGKITDKPLGGLIEYHLKYGK